MKRRLTGAVLTTVAYLLFAMGASSVPVDASAQIVLEADLTGNLALPATDSPAMGKARLVLSHDRTEVRYTVTLTGLLGQEIEARIHHEPLDSNGPSVADLPLGNDKAGVWYPSEFQVEELLAGRLTLVIYTDPYLTGEIRGQIVQVSVAKDEVTWGRLKAIFSS